MRKAASSPMVAARRVLTFPRTGFRAKMMSAAGCIYKLKLSSKIDLRTSFLVTYLVKSTIPFMKTIEEHRAKVREIAEFAFAHAINQIGKEE